VIHLDANARQSKGGYDPNWGRLGELARDLATSPLYVFHYLNVWLRQQSKLDAPPIDRVRQYLKLYEFIDPGQKAMNHPRRLTEMYRRFYRAKSQFAKANAVLKPIDIAADAVLKADRALFAQDGGALVDVVCAELNALMQRVHRSEAEGRWVFSNSEDERHAVREFAEVFVNDLFLVALRGDAARLAGTQLNLLRDTCDTLYREMDDTERAEKRARESSAEAGEKPRLYPVEYKHGRRGEWKNDRLQLCAQALCLEDMLNLAEPIPFGYLFYAQTARREEVRLDEELRRFCLETIERVHRLMESGERPPTIHTARCRGCSLHSICLPRETEMLRRDTRKQ
jgi:CRISPR/Cas system-associated exonuclease Cas4 (RecB family)